MTRPLFNTMRKLLGGAALAAVLFAGTSAATAGTVYDVINHPDGNAIVGNDVDGSGYVLRLDMGLDTHTFNANTLGNLTLTVDSDNNQLILAGQVTHNQSGTNTAGADAGDDVYNLLVTLAGPQLTDATPGDLWYDDNDADKVYDTMLDDLLADATPSTGDQTNVTFGPDKTRASFFIVDLLLTPEQTNLNLGQTYPQDKLVWDEFPDNMGKPLLIQYDWRMNGADMLGAAGWLETDPQGNRFGTSDLLFALKPKASTPPTAVIPTPAALPAGLMLMGMLIARRRQNA